MKTGEKKLSEDFLAKLQWHTVFLLNQGWFFLLIFRICSHIFHITVQKCCSKNAPFFSCQYEFAAKWFFISSSMLRAPPLRCSPLTLAGWHNWTSSCLWLVLRSVLISFFPLHRIFINQEPSKGNRRVPYRIPSSIMDRKNNSSDKRSGQSDAPPKIHRRIPEKNFKCSECDERFSAVDNLSLHKRIAHGKDKELKCLYCPKRFTGHTSLEYHHQIVHLREKKFKGHSHGEPSGQTENLKVHHQSDHLEHKDQMCDKSVGESDDLKIQKQTPNLEETIFKCSECDKSFIDSSVLKLHQRKHHAKVQKVQKYHRSFGPTGLLKIRVQTVPVQAEPKKEAKRNFKCPMCGERFEQAKTLKLHKLAHHHQKKYKWQIHGVKSRINVFSTVYIESLL